jgi:tRNA A-37 threonylcarbamoyl transferase component Bud32
MSSAEGPRLERYELLEVLGQGATGIVYKARDRQLHRLVAIKTLRPRPEDGTAAGACLLAEASAAARLAHPNVVAVHDVVLADGGPHVVMEYVRGHTLAALLEAGPWPVERAVRLVVQVCRALAYAHAAGVVHGDIKSGNVIVDATGAPKITDFGVARMGERAGVTGTPAYMAPEQLQGREGDARSDLFSLAVVLYEAVTGRRPFAGEDVPTVLAGILHDDPLPAREINPAVPPALDAVIERALCKRPAERYQDAPSFAQALEQALPEAGPRRRWIGPRGAVTAAGVLVIVALAAGTINDHRDAGPGPAPALEGSGPASAVPARGLGSRGGQARVAPSATEHGTPSSSPVAVSRAAAPQGDRAGRTPDAPAPPTRPRPPRELPAAPVALAVPAPSQTAGGRRPRPDASRPDAEAPAPDADRPAAPERASAPPAATPETFGCLSVNAVPFAAVYVDGEHAGDTPRACLRVRTGARVVRFQSPGRRSPDRRIVVTAEHTSEDPLRLSYDFLVGRFLGP